ncbi:MAG: type II toxin-antitoxin system RelE/ParE family toxin [Candidatus Omnitrophica bacterium]|nr:type II toxin-antitoxin system RelE/ParE family toxin [Candidatus Omnitrophota bacterium]MCK4422995.1 type II toxin-antitoxin system RelE/ParE family toxin [Candidatus Omnitrophota bacterium]
MEITYKTTKLKKVFEGRKKLIKDFGPRQAYKITQRMNELHAAVSLHDIKCNPSAGLHALSGKYKDYLAIDLNHPYRLIIEPEDGDREDYRTITIVKIIKVEDYH